MQYTKTVHKQKNGAIAQSISANFTYHTVLLQQIVIDKLDRIWH